VKIAFISRWLMDEHQRSGGVGGGEEQRVQAYRDLGHEVMALSQADDAQGMEMRQLNGIPVVVTPRWKRLPPLAPFDKLLKPLTRHRKAITDAWWLRRFLRQYGPFDLIEAQCEEPDGLVVAVLSCFQKLPPVAVQIFALRYHFEDHRPVFEQRRALGFVFRRAALVKANSELVARHLQDDYACPPEKIAVVPHNLARQSLDTPAAASIGQSEYPRIVCLGALNEKKGIHFFLEAAALLRPRLPRAKFISIGGSTTEDRYAGELRATAQRLQLDNHLTWLGELRGEKLRAEIAAAAVVVIPSLFDEWNRAAVEVVSLGRPVVVSDGCGAANWLDQWKAGMVVPAADAGALAGAIAQVLGEPHFAASAQKHAADVRAALAPAVIAEKSLDHFHGLLSSKRT
jgi:glycosyltransferase involved in cell wall biosynthesis